MCSSEARINKLLCFIRWFMKYQHVDPEEAVRIHIDVQAKKSVAIHWGTFALANEVSAMAMTAASVSCVFRDQSGIRICPGITVIT